MDAKAQAQVTELLAKTAANIGEQLGIVFDEPELPMVATSLTRFPWLNARWYETTRLALEALGFRHLGDFDASALKAPNARASVLRLLVSADGQIATGVYEIIPQRPGLLMWLYLKAVRKWPAPARVAELLSYAQGHALTTINTDSMFDVGPAHTRKVMPSNTPLRELMESHRAQLAAHVTPIESHDTAADWLRARDEARRRQNAWRKEVGLLPAERARLLAQIPEWADQLAPLLDLEIARRRKGT